MEVLVSGIVPISRQLGEVDVAIVLLRKEQLDRDPLFLKLFQLRLRLILRIHLELELHVPDVLQAQLIGSLDKKIDGVILAKET